MANIRDIAEFTGLSTATVSRYLNKHPYVSKEAQLAIELAMTQLGYHPNAAARSLRSGKTRRVGVVLDALNHSFYSSLLAGFSEVARRRSYDILVQQSGAHDWSPGLLLEQAAARSMDGIIVASETEKRGELLSLVGTVPLVACDQALFGADCPQVYIDHYQSTIDGLEYLRRGGATSIACVYGPCSACSSNRFRRRAYTDFGARSDAPFVHEVICNEDTVKGGYDLFERLMALSPRPDAVFTGADEVAVGVITAAGRAGVAVPSDLAVLGFDDNSIAEVFGISTIRQPVQAMGRRAMEILMRLIADGPRASVKRVTRVKYRLVARQSA